MIRSEDRGGCPPGKLTRVEPEAGGRQHSADDGGAAMEFGTALAAREAAGRRSGGRGPSTPLAAVSQWWLWPSERRAASSGRGRCAPAQRTLAQATYGS